MNTDQHEPTVLDYVKSLLTPWKGPPLQIPPAPGDTALSQAEEELSTTPVPLAESIPSQEEPALQDSEGEPDSTLSEPAPPRPPIKVPWASLAAFALGAIAQLALQPRPDRSWIAGAILYWMAGTWLIWATWKEEWTAAPPPPAEETPDTLSIHTPALVASLALGAAAFLAFGGGLFTPLNLALWLLALIFAIGAFWLAGTGSGATSGKLRQRLANPAWNLRISRQALLVLALAGVVLFFRSYRLAEVPPEMTSDHAEKLMDVDDVLRGQYSIFFPRNTGREPLQFYLTAAVARVFGTGLSFLSLKIGTLLGGLVLVCYMYLLGKEVANRRVGFLAAFFTGVGYWPVVITRVALRFSLYPLFVAPTLYYLLRGIRRSNRNDFILAGLFLGLGLHGYTPARILPFVILTAIGLYLLHRQSKGQRLKTVIMLAMLVVISLLVFLPLLRYAQQNPESFAFRAFSRLGDWERALPASAAVIFLQNLWNAMVMFAWDNGTVWTVSIPGRPALDLISAVLFYLGLLLLVVRYIRQRHWLDAFLVLSVPLLMLPSILSLAFPEENPVLNRTSGALVPVFLIAALALDGFLRALENGFHSPRLAWGIAAVLLAWIGLQNYDLVFNQYQKQYSEASWNTSEMDHVLQNFSDLTGSQEVYIFSYPYWVDTRLVMLNSGAPLRDYAVGLDQLPATADNPGAKLFLLNIQDQASLDALRSRYPQGWMQVYQSKYGENKNFNMYFVPPQQ